MGAASRAASGALAGSAFGPWGTVIGAGIGLFGNLFGAKKQSDAAVQAAQIQSEYAYRAAQLQDQAQREALAFQRQQAQNAYANSETARRGNYDQWASRERRLGSIGQLLGYGSREVPGYVPGVDPHFDVEPTPVAYGRPPAPMPVGAPQRDVPVSRTMPVPYGSIDSYLQPNIHPGVLMPAPYRRVGPVGSYLR
ncbi:MAG TPA: hypothetical protein VGQ19_19550 [Burkholderiales bacterium]|jgi:hypothetical protein|nr:hypothetical protein [Burkholderiales bacterium]